MQTRGILRFSSRCEVADANDPVAANREHVEQLAVELHAGQLVELRASHADGELAPEDRDALRVAGVPVTERPVASVAAGLVRFADGGELAVDALHVVAPMAPRDDLAARLGVATTELPNGTGIAVADTFGTTSVPGVFAAGDAASAGNVAAAIAGGSLAATGLHRTVVVG